MHFSNLWVSVALLFRLLGIEGYVKIINLQIVSANLLILRYGRLDVLESVWPEGLTVSRAGVNMASGDMLWRAVTNRLANRFS